MKRTMLTALLAFAFGLGLALIASESMAVHKGSTGLTCGSCHTMHNSQGNTTMGGAGTTGNFRLIRMAGTGAAQTADLCLSCHSENGGNGATQFNTGTWLTTPPKVYLTTAWITTDPIDFSKVGAGGDFAFVGSFNGTTWTLTSTGKTGAGVNGDDNVNALGRGHSIEESNPTPPGNTTNGNTAGTALTGTFTCTSCHDAHGTASTSNNINKFRNLKAGSMITGVQNVWSDMSTYGDLANTYVGAVGGTAFGGKIANTTNDGTADRANVWPVYNGTSQNVYTYKGVTVNLGGSARTGDNSENVGLSAFCSQCHGAWHEAVYTGNGGTTDWNRHPVNHRLTGDGTLNSGAGNQIIDTSNYGKNGAGATTSGYGLPVAASTTSDKYYIDGTTNTTANSKVFCLSCHFAHGGPNNDALRWDYTSSVTSGNQTRNVVGTYVGCQQCHNK